MKEVKKSSKVKSGSESKVKELEERLNALERIESEKMKPKSEIRTTGKRFFPIAIGMFFAFVSGLAIYGTASAVRFYADYGDTSSLLVSLAFLIFMFALIATATLTVHRSEWGYRLRSFVVVMIVVASAAGFAAVLMQGPVERLADKIGITSRLRAEDRILGESTVYGRISDVDKDSIEVDLTGGGEIEFSIDDDTRVFPMNYELKKGQVVAVILKADSRVASWIRVLPPSHPAGRKIVSGFFETRFVVSS